MALKEIQDRFADQPSAGARFLREAEITSKLDHPGVVPVYGAGAYSTGRPYYAMRFIQGDSLDDAVAAFHAADRKGRSDAARWLELRQLLGRFVAVCNAVGYAHSKGVIHRDLKPGNIMLGNYGETLVVDWGLAKVIGQPDTTTSERGLVHAGASMLTQAGETLGTPAYMSPEQAAGRLDQLSPASDVYSLGATLYCLLAGQPPFPQEDIGVVLAKVQKGDFLPPRQVNARVPRALEAVCLKAMALKSADRYASCRELADDVERWLADEPVSAHRESTLARVKRWRRRNRVLLRTGSIALAVVLLVAGGAWMLISKARHAEVEQGKRATESAKEAVKQAEIAPKAAEDQLEKARSQTGDHARKVAEQMTIVKGARGKNARSPEGLPGPQP